MTRTGRVVRTEGKDGCRKKNVKPDCPGAETREKVFIFPTKEQPETYSQESSGWASGKLSECPSVPQPEFKPDPNTASWKEKENDGA